MADRARRSRTLNFARITKQPGRLLFFPNTADAIESCIDPKYRTTRYERTWRFSKAHRLDARFLAAKLGFVRAGEHEAVHFDEEQGDFVEVKRPSEEGNFSHFVVDTEHYVLVFEERLPDVRRQSFLGAFRALVRDEAKQPLEIEALSSHAKFRQWLETIDRLVRFRAVLSPPNPSWRPGTDDVRKLIEGTAADRVIVEASVEERGDGSLKVDTSIIDASAEHAEGGYARIKAVGLRQDRRREFSSDQNIETDRIEETHDDTSETIFTKVAASLRRRFR